MATKAPSPKRREFAYGHGFFLQRLLLFALFAAFLLAFLAFMVHGTPPEWLAGLAVLLTVYIVVWGVSPLLTDHWLTTTRLVLRQGWYFRTVLPLREIEGVEPFEGRVPLGLRAPFGRRRLYATGSKVGLVSVRLRRPRRFWAVLGADADEIVFDVDSRDRFLEAFRERQTSLAPVQAERADAYLRD